MSALAAGSMAPRRGVVEGPVRWADWSTRIEEVVRSQIDDEIDSRPTRSYTPAEAKEVAATICERCMLMLRDLAAERWKLIVSTTVLPSGAPVQAVSSCLWDATFDGSVVVKWTSASSPTVVIVTVYGMRL